MSARWWVPLLGAALLGAVPWLGDETLMQFGIYLLLVAVLAQAWNILGGFTGYASFGNSTFYGLGVYGTAIAMAQFGLPFWVGLILGAILAMLCALLVGLPILRLRGPYFAIATLGLNAALAALVANLDIAGRNIGLILPLTRNDRLFYEGMVALLLAATLTVAWISSSRFGMGLIAIREDEDAAAVMGVNTTLYKIAALVLSALFSALAGGIHAYYVTFIDPGSAFDPKLNVQMVIMAVFGGPGTVLGPVIGAFLLYTVYQTAGEQHLDRRRAVLRRGHHPRGDLHAEGPGRSRRRPRRMGPRYLLQTVRQYRL